MRQNEENVFKPHFKRFFLDSYHCSRDTEKAARVKKTPMPPVVMYALLFAPCMFCAHFVFCRSCCSCFVTH
jgi:hypothetical protein